jgi:hypothetical protein
MKMSQARQTLTQLLYVLQEEIWLSYGGPSRRKWHPAGIEDALVKQLAVNNMMPTDANLISIARQTINGHEKYNLLDDLVLILWMLEDDGQGIDHDWGPIE